MTNLKERITFGELADGSFRLAQKTAEEAVTRSLVGLNKSKSDFKKAGIRLVKGVAIKAVGSFIDNAMVDTAVEVVAGYQFVRGGFNAYQGVKNFTEGYSNASDEDVEELKALLDLSEE